MAPKDLIVPTYLAPAGPNGVYVTEAMAGTVSRIDLSNGEKKVVAFNLSGHGHFDLGAYDSYLKGDLEHYEYPEDKVKEAMAELPEIPAPA